jgi:Uma2 family endonuclease
MAATRAYIPKQFLNVHSFEKWANRQESGYEYANQKVRKKEMIKNYEITLIYWLTTFFQNTEAYLKKGLLLSEVGVKLPTGNFRVPDLAYFTKEQSFLAGRGEYPIPSLAIEFLSDSESYDDVEDKINDYFRAGVQVVWYLNPKKQTIHLYSSAKEVKILSGDDVCSASPAIPDFQFMVKEVFVV